MQTTNGKAFTRSRESAERSALFRLSAFGIGATLLVIVLSTQPPGLVAVLQHKPSDSIAPSLSPAEHSARYVMCNSLPPVASAVAVVEDTCRSTRAPAAAGDAALSAASTLTLTSQLSSAGSVATPHRVLDTCQWQCAMVIDIDTCSSSSYTQGASC